MINKIENLIEVHPNYVESKVLENGDVVLGLYRYTTDYGYGDVQSNEDDVFETLENLEECFGSNVVDGDEVDEVAKWIRDILELPEDCSDCTTQWNDESDYQTILIRRA